MNTIGAEMFNEKLYNCTNDILMDQNEINMCANGTGQKLFDCDKDEQKLE